MPSFEQGILSSPIGFNNGCGAINSFSEEFDNYLQHIEQTFHCLKVGKGAPIMSKDIKNLDRTIEHICRLCLFSNPKPDSAEVAHVLNSCSILSEQAVLGFTQGLDNYTAQSSDGPSTFSGSHMGQICNLKWRLGVAVGSSVCGTLSSPYVSVSFVVRESDGKECAHAMELTLSEFQDFAGTFRDIAAVMDNL